MNNGLTTQEVQINRKKYGTNRINTSKKNSFYKLFLETLGDPIIKILLIALAVKTIFLFQDFDWFETIGIVIAILVASLISTISEYGSEEAFNKLQEESSKIKCKVKRNNKIEEISIDDIVVNDIVLLQTGDKIPADGKIIKGEITVDESSINGETNEALKRENSKLYRGCVVYSKEAYMKVEQVGDETFYGKMAKELQEPTPDSPLKIRLRNLAKIISRIGYIGAILVSFSYLFSEIVVVNNFELSKIYQTITNFPLLFKYILEALTLSVTIIVVAVPEGLPMMITLVLSSNMKKMLKNNVLVRKLVGIETAGSLNILYTDKTGTLTKGKLEVVSFLSGSLEKYNSEQELINYKIFHEHFYNSCFYNNASSFDINELVVGGNITDQAILKFIKLNPKNNYKKLEILPFDSSLKYSSTAIDREVKTTYYKGSPEKIISLCTNYISELGIKKPINNRPVLLKQIIDETSKGVRAIALAYNDNYHYKEFTNLTLIGVLFIKDDVRKEAKEGVNLVKNAGIQTVMITGDSKETAISIAKELNIISSSNDIVLTGKELATLSDEAVKRIIPNLKVVARSMPQDKSRLVKLSEELNLVVGMTGDGVNDAPALKKADVGFSMGSGTEVAKEASDIVILDDNFKSIANAILYGRTIFKSIRKFIIFQLTINLCAVTVSILGPFLGIETPVTVIQMLWINMIMDTLAGIAFSYEPTLKEYMNEPPKHKKETIMNSYMLQEVLITGLYSSLFSILFLKNNFIKNLYRQDINNKYLMTAFFTLFIFMSIFNSFNARTTRLNLFANLNRNKIFIIVIIFIVVVQFYLIYFGGSIFRTYGLTPKELLITIILASTVIPIDLLRKLATKLFNKKISI